MIARQPAVDDEQRERRQAEAVAPLRMAFARLSPLTDTEADRLFADALARLKERHG